MVSLALVMSYNVTGEYKRSPGVTAFLTRYLTQNR
jgi:hypothetical protein